MLIVNNKNKIVGTKNVLFVFLILILSMAFIGFVLKNLIVYYLRWPLFMAMIIVVILIFYQIKRLKVFQFENTGSTFTIKYYHPLNKRIIFPYVEFPISSITGFKIEKKLIRQDILKIEILLREKRRVVCFKFKVSGLSDESYAKIQNSLQEITLK
ncbi:hypothetical protein [Chryseobacterium indoltheticum]|uniref:hypothetical protein n=1 Tax=Chryseobacterium indoltheticum TaxID=254 RepID=UPI003F497E62